MLGYIEVAKDQKWEDPNDPAKVGIINKKPAHELFRRFDETVRELFFLGVARETLCGRIMEGISQ